jgi:asparagine synthase (glutamine-hydrolysing)
MLERRPTCENCNVPTERFHQMMQDTLRGPVLASLPFYDQKKVIALLD